MVQTWSLLWNVPGTMPAATGTKSREKGVSTRLQAQGFLFQLFQAFLAVRDYFGNDPPDVDGQERLLDHGAAAFRDELPQGGGERIAGDETHAPDALGPAALDFLKQGAPVD